MTHIETLEFELKALKSVLESQIMIRESYVAQYQVEYLAGRTNGIQAKACVSVFREYRDKHIPRTERHIAALEWILEKSR